MTLGTPPPKRFRVAFSFAGKQRVFVSKVAAILGQRFGDSSILYDEFHFPEFANANLGFKLPHFYHADSDLIVCVFSAGYMDKVWCGMEWRAIYSLITQGEAKRVMLTNFDHVEGKDLYGLATVILERLALNEGKPATCNGPTIPAAGIKISNNLPRPVPFFGR